MNCRAICGCGSGTIPLEAAQVFPSVTAHGVDKSAAVVRGAVANADAAGLSGRCTFGHGNCRELHSTFASGPLFDAVASNVPWGVQTAKGGNGDELLDKIYRGLLSSSWHVTKPNARCALLVLKWNLLLDIARRSGLWTVEALVPIRTSALSPVIVVLVRRDADEERRGVLETLRAYSAYFHEVTAPSPHEGKKREAGHALKEREASEEQIASRGSSVDVVVDVEAVAAVDDEEPGEDEDIRGGANAQGTTGAVARGGRGGPSRSGKPDPGAIVPFIHSKFTTRVAYEAWVQQRHEQNQKQPRGRGASRSRGHK